MGGSSAELRLPKIAVSVDLARGGRPERVELFVADSPRRSRTALAGEVAELLEDDATQFLPVREPEAPGGPRVALVGKRAITTVAIPLTTPIIQDVDEFPEETSGIFNLYDHVIDIQVELEDGTALRGHLLYSSPADRPRLADHLNLPGHFLRLWTNEALYLINKHHIVRVLEEAGA